MNRRTLLAGAGIALVTGLGGCLVDATSPDDAGNENGSDDGSRNESDDGGRNGNDDGNGDGIDDRSIPDSPSDYPRDTGGLDAFDPAGTYEEVDVGSREGVDDAYRPHDVRVWNAGAVPAIELRIVDATGEAVVHDATHEIPEDDELTISLLKPSVYLVELRIPTAGTRQTVRVPCTLFDCNGSATQIGVLEDGRIEGRVVTTLAGCPSADC